MPSVQSPQFRLSREAAGVQVSAQNGKILQKVQLVAILERLMMLWLTLLCLIAYFFPAAGIPFDPFVESKPYLANMIQLAMFAIGTLLPPDELRQLVRRWPTVLGGTATQYLAMPLLGYAAAMMFASSQADRIGLILCGTVPGAMASNVVTLLARGNISYSISLTTASTLLSPIAVPTALALFLGESLPLDWLKQFTDLLTTVVLPVASGHIVRRLFPACEPFIRRFCPSIGNVVILWIIAVVVALNRGHIAEGEPILIAAMLFINMLGFAAGYLSATAMGVEDSMRRALTLEVGMQNTGLGTTLALLWFPSIPGAAVAPAIYSFLATFTGACLARYWGRTNPKDKTHPTRTNA